MSLMHTWDEQYINEISTALKDRNLFEMEVNALIKAIRKLIELKDPQANINILELGCGTGVLIRTMNESLRKTHPNLNFVGVDFSSNAIKQATTKRDARQNFAQSEFISFLDSTDSNAFDIVVTQRSIMALMKDEQQRELLAGINRVLRLGGAGVFSECFREPFQRFNDLRKSSGLACLSKVWHSRYLNESMIESIFGDISYIDFCSTYMVITRLIYPLFEQPQHNQPIHDIAARLPNSGSDSFLKLAIVHKHS